MEENEIKFALRNYAELETQLTPLGWHDITQGYLNPNARVRRITYPDGGQQHFFTYKQRLPNGHNLEFEPVISPAEFEAAWPYTIERVTKRRIRLESEQKWDVDFYRWSQPYFVLAEVEMPVDMQRPSVIPPVLASHIVFEVPRDDGRFAARRLADEGHARALAAELGLGD